MRELMEAGGFEDQSSRKQEGLSVEEGHEFNYVSGQGDNSNVHNQQAPWAESLEQIRDPNIVNIKDLKQRGSSIKSKDARVNSLALSGD